MKPRLNPFRSTQLESLSYRFHEIPESEIVERLAHLNFRGAIVGPHGSGKTTLLERISSSLNPELVWINVRPENRSLPEMDRLSDAHALLVDGADLLLRRDWLILCWKARRAGAFIITSHVEGLLPTVALCRTTSSLLGDLIGSLTGSCPAFVDELYDRHDGNLREALREMYDVYSRLSE